MVSKTHGTIIPLYQVHGTVFIVVFKTTIQQFKNVQVSIILIVSGKEEN